MSRNKEQVRRAYASVADLYIDLFGTSRQVHPDDLAFIGRHLVSRPGAVLDVGCGPGNVTDYRRGLGVDARRRPSSAARRHCGDRGDR